MRIEHTKIDVVNNNGKKVIQKRGYGTSALFSTLPAYFDESDVVKCCNYVGATEMEIKRTLAYFGFADEPPAPKTWIDKAKAGIANGCWSDDKIFDFLYKRIGCNKLPEGSLGSKKWENFFNEQVDLKNERYS